MRTEDRNMKVDLKKTANFNLRFIGLLSQIDT